MGKKIIAVIPAFNEEKYIGEVVKETRQYVDEVIVVDFNGVEVLTPSWADEFLTPLIKLYGGKVNLKNPKYTFTIIEDVGENIKKDVPFKRVFFAKLVFIFILFFLFILLFIIDLII